MNKLNNYRNLLRTSVPKVSKPYFVESDDGVQNACVKIEGYEHPFRARSSMLILKKGANGIEVFLRNNNKNGEYNAPGGGRNERESPKNAAIRETQEECGFNTKEVEHCGHLLEYSDIVQDWVKNHVKNKDEWRYGYYSKVYVSKYDGKFEGDIDEMDKDTIGSEGKWYLFDNIKDKIPKEYKQAIEKYIKNKTLKWTHIKEGTKAEIQKILLKANERKIERQKAKHEKLRGFPLEKWEDAVIEYHEFCDEYCLCPPSINCSRELEEKIKNFYKEKIGNPYIVESLGAKQYLFNLLKELPCSNLIIDFINKKNYEKYWKIPINERLTGDVSIDPTSTPHGLICPNKIGEEIKRVYKENRKDIDNIAPELTERQKLYEMFINSPHSDIVRRFLDYPRVKKRGECK